MLGNSCFFLMLKATKGTRGYNILQPWILKATFSRHNQDSAKHWHSIYSSQFADQAPMPVNLWITKHFSQPQHA